MFRFLYDLNLPLQLKIETIAKEMYGAKSVEFDEKILNKLKIFELKVINLLLYLFIYFYFTCNYE